MSSDTVIYDQSIPEKCQAFIHTHHEILSSKKLRNVLLLHFLNLWDNRLLSSNHVQHCMTLYDSLDNNSYNAIS